MRCDRGGKVSRRFVPKREDGSTEMSSGSNVRVDSKARIWGTDGVEFYEIDSKGVVHTRFGAAPDPFKLEKAAEVLLDDIGHVALIDERTGAVHMFGADGAPGYVYAPDPTDFPGGSRDVDSLVRSHDGALYLQSESDARSLAFTADGRRVDWTSLGNRAFVFLANGERWAENWSLFKASRVLRLAPDGSERVRIERRPNGWFFETIYDLSCASNGSLAVLTAGEQDLEVDLFRADGTPERTVVLHDAPRGWWRRMNHTERWILVSSYSNEALLISLPNGKLSLVRCADGEKGSTHSFGFSPDGKELWCATLRPPALHRFALPE